MRSLIIILNVLIIGCNTNSTQKIEPPKPDCSPGTDTINHEINFTKNQFKSSSKRFNSIVDVIIKIDLFRPRLNKNGNIDTIQKNKISFPVAYYTCNMQRLTRKNYIIKNIKITELDFKAIRVDKISRFTPWLHLEEWQFSNTSDRDSALNILKTVYNYPDNIVMYEKRYSQFIIDGKRIYLLESRAKFAEQFAIDYKKILEKYISKNKPDE